MFENRKKKEAGHADRVVSEQGDSGKRPCQDLNTPAGMDKPKYDGLKESARREQSSSANFDGQMAGFEKQKPVESLTKPEVKNKSQEEG